MLLKFAHQLNKNNEVCLRLKINPGAPETKIKEILADADGNTIKIDIAAPADKGRAYKEIIRFLAKEFEVLKNNIKIIKGAKEKIKLIKITK